MADSLEYAFTCQVCFEDFKETGDHVPRLLPCTHTLCETCVGQLIRRDTMQCPECRQKHRATKKEKSFPQNKYILVNIKKRPISIEENFVSPKQPDFDLCEKHNRPRSLYCVEDLCQKLICHFCLKDEHRSHEFEEAQQIIEEKYKNFIEHVDSLTESLLFNKEKLLMVKKDAKKDTMEFTEKITRTKDEQIATVVRMMTHLYNTMIAEFDDSFTDISTKIDNKTSEIDLHLAVLSHMKEKSETSMEDIENRITTVNVMAENITFTEMEKFKTLHYHESQPFTWDDISKFTGTLYSKDAQIDMKPLRKLPLLSKTTTWKTIQSTSELELQGKQNCTHHNI